MATDALTIHEAAATTGWSSRMLRYIEEAGLVAPRRSRSGYRLYGPAELQRLPYAERAPGTLRHRVERRRLRLKAPPRRAIAEGLEAWFSSEAVRPAEVEASQWLAFEQQKHTQLLAAAAADEIKEIA